MNAGAPLLDVKELSVSYGRIRALRDVDLTVDQGEIVTLLGANGGGKTTFMRAIAGLERPASGEVKFEGTPLPALNAHSRTRAGIALVPEGRKIFAPMTVREHLRLGMLNVSWHGARSVFSERLDDVCQLFPDLSSRLKTAVGDLSGGQQQMVVIGRALMAEPRLLLLDEPSLGLAPRVIDEVFDVLQSLNSERGLGILLAEQSIDNALSIADRAYVLRVGEVVVEEDAEVLMTRGDVHSMYLGEREIDVS